MTPLLLLRYFSLPKQERKSEDEDKCDFVYHDQQGRNSTTTVAHQVEEESSLHDDIDDYMASIDRADGLRHPCKRSNFYKNDLEEKHPLSLDWEGWTRTLKETVSDFGAIDWDNNSEIGECANCEFIPSISHLRINESSQHHYRLGEFSRQHRQEDSDDDHHHDSQSPRKECLTSHHLNSINSSSERPNEKCMNFSFDTSSFDANSWSEPRWPSFSLPSRKQKQNKTYQQETESQQLINEIEHSCDTKFASLETSIASYNAEIHALEEITKIQNTEIAAMRTEINQLTSTYGEETARIDREIEEWTHRIQSLQQQDKEAEDRLKILNESLTVHVNEKKSGPDL